MLYLILSLLFIMVFVFLGWRILTLRQTAQPPADSFVCPHCNEKDCNCHQQQET